MPTSWSKHHPAFSLSLRLIAIPQSLHFKDLWSCSIRYMFADAPSHLTECRITGPLLWSTYIVTTDCGPNHWWNLTTSIIVHIPKLWSIIDVCIAWSCYCDQRQTVLRKCFRNIARFSKPTRKLRHITDANFVITRHHSSFWNHQCVL